MITLNTVSSYTISGYTLFYFPYYHAAESTEGGHRTPFCGLMNYSVRDMLRFFNISFFGVDEVGP